MTPVLQRHKTDCLTAAIASLLDIPYDECPQLWDYVGEEWVDRLRSWCRARKLGLVYFSLKDRREWPILDGIRAIVVGPTKRSTEYHHCIICRGVTQDGETRLEYEFDPYEYGNGLDGDPDHCIFFVKP